MDQPMKIAGGNRGNCFDWFVVGSRAPAGYRIYTYVGRGK